MGYYSQRQKWSLYIFWHFNKVEWHMYWPVTRSSLVQKMPCGLVSAKPLHETMQYCCIVNWTIRNKIHLNLNQTKRIFIHFNDFENDICKMVIQKIQWGAIYTLSNISQKCNGKTHTTKDSSKIWFYMHHNDTKSCVMAPKSLPTQLFVQQLVQVISRENIKTPNYQWLVDSVHKGPVILKAFP